VTAKDLGSGKEQQIKITAKSGLSEDEIKRMVKEAELHAEDDKKKHEAVTNKNSLDNMVYQTEKLIRDNKDKLSEDDIKPLEAAVASAKTVLANTSASAEDFNSALDTLTTASHGVSSKLYEKSKAAPGAEGGAGADGGAGGGGAHAHDATGEAGGSGGKGGDDVIDADYKDVN
jgi:molecular chaperone DnaK